MKNSIVVFKYQTMKEFKPLNFKWVPWLEGLTIIGIAVPVYIIFKPEPEPLIAPNYSLKVIELSLEDKKQLKCLTDNAYFEAGNQSWDGKMAVSQVVMNRVDDPRYPNTPCDVIYQRTETVCQFSWVCEKNLKVQSREQYRQSYEAAFRIYQQYVDDKTYGAKFYHANYVHPYWADKKRRTIQIGDHIFYKG